MLTICVGSFAGSGIPLTGGFPALWVAPEEPRATGLAVACSISCVIPLRRLFPPG